MDVERALVGRIAQTGRGVDAVLAAGIAPEDFADERSAEIFSFIADHHARWDAAPSYSLV